ncbi:MAG: ACT domain-containing protein [Clostridiales bacterium]|nr:ACT domain-containing protein [Clostridiales bacterium]
MSEEKAEYYLVDKSVLPEVFLKVMEVKRRLNTGESPSINNACKELELSRSAYYKYKDTILPFYADLGRKVTILFSVENFPGILSQIINIISGYKANILTINQNIPINGLADISISFDAGSILGSVEDIISDIGKITGVRNCSILSRE